MIIKQVVEEADGLDGLPQTHLISKDATVASVNEDRVKENRKSSDCGTPVQCWVMEHLMTMGYITFQSQIDREHIDYQISIGYFSFQLYLIFHLF